MYLKKYIKLLLKFCSALALILWMLFIFNMSAKNGNQSAGLSEVFARFFYRIYFIKKMCPFHVFHTIIRKCAHFTEYGILAILIINFFYAFGLFKFEMSKKYYFLWFAGIILFCFLYASGDEYHQSFVDGRCPAFLDVIVDTCGSIFFTLIYLAIINIIINIPIKNSQKH